jgi:hypothetical protein
MKKLFDRRFCGFIYSVTALAIVGSMAKEYPGVAAIYPMFSGTVIGLFGIMVTGSTVEKVKNPSQPGVENAK